MGKRLVHDYEFSADSNKITFNEILTQDRFLLITNVTDGVGVFTFNDPNNGISAASYDYDNTKTTITLEKDTSSMSDSDVLQIFVEDNSTAVEFDETYIDPVAKIRVSQPENLIDTDFEYGLQSTKWETLELVKNIPTFFSRNGDLSLDIISIEVRAESDVVIVTCNENHGLSRGVPVLVQGTKNQLANGGFVVTSVISETVFEYKSKGFFTSTTNIFDTYTQIFIASIYQGTEFDLQGIAAVTTDEGLTSKLIVKTQFPTSFEVGTSFFLTNSFAKANLRFNGDSSQVDPVNARIVTKTSGVNNVATGESSTGWANGVVQPYSWQPFTDIPNTNGLYNAIFFNQSEVSYSGNQITFSQPHGWNSGRYTLIRYQQGEGGTGFGGITSGNQHYFCYIDSATTIRILYRMSTSYARNITSQGSDGITKSAFYSGIPIYYVRRNGYMYATTLWDNYSSTSTTVHREALAQVNRWYWSVDTSSVFDSYTSYENPTILRLGTDGFDGSNRLLFTYSGDINNTVINANLYRFGQTASGSLHTATRDYSYDGSPDTNDNADNYGLYIPMKLADDANSIYIQNHGFTDGSACTVTATAGTLPTGLTNGGSYIIKKVSNDRIAFKTVAGQDVNFTSAGSADLTVQVVSLSLNLNGDTINISENTFSNGDEVIYNNNGVTNIPGLVDGTTYYVYEKTGDKVKLATTVNGLTDSAGKNLVVDQQSTSADPRLDGSGNIYSTNNTLVDGEIVKLNQKTGPNTSGFVEGAHYFVKKNSNIISLYPSDSDRVNNSNVISLNRTSTGTFDVRKSTLVDITGYDSGEHSLIANFVGAADGVYSLDSAYESAGSYIFTLSNAGQVLRRTQTLTHSSDVDLYHNALRINNHGYITGNTVEVTSNGTPIGQVSDGLYWVKRISQNWFRLANSEYQALDSTNAYIVFDSAGSGTTTFAGTSIVGETVGIGSISITEGSNIIFGTDTKFSSVFNAGDDFNVYIPEKLIADSASAISTAENSISPTDSAVLYDLGKSVFITADVYPSGITEGQRYYTSTNGSTCLLHTNPTDARANGSLSLGNNPVQFTTSGTNVAFNRQDTIGLTREAIIDYVNSNTKLILKENITDSSELNAGYSVDSKLLIRADGFALHRPYDGGVELIPSTNPDSKMIRQTRKYFRYQSGKGIQVSYAVNFKPSVDIESFTRTGSTGTITTRYPHRINVVDSDGGLDIIVKNAGNGADYWNGQHRVTSVVNDTQFTVGLDGTPADQAATGIPTYYVNNWLNCALRCGLFDDQNGLFFEFDGDQLYCVIRSSTQQISGACSVQFKSGDVYGTNTKFTQQISAGESIVIKGQTYLITKVSSDTLMHILPSYRGSSQDNVILTKTIDRKVPQSEWNLDKCDGKGKTGFKLDLGKIQMAYIDYSWYGAGKVRFGFKNQHGVVRYVHEFVHGNYQTEAYMRSGNLPARYELASSGTPTYVPALAHWGTSVIMDGRFDDDKAYVFTANSLTTTLLSEGAADSAGDVVLSAPGTIERNDYLGISVSGQIRTIGFGVFLSSTSTQYNTFTAGMPITGAGIAAGTSLANPLSTDVQPQQPYLPSVGVYRYSSGRWRWVGTRNVLLIDKQPTEGQSDTYQITVQEAAEAAANISVDTSIGRDIPIISIRLAPSVDTNTPGVLGEREIINRMQLILTEVDILTTHGLEVELRVNGLIDNNDWSRVDNPSLSQLIYHGSADQITGGTTVFSFNAQGSSAATRAAILTAKALGDVATLGNSILGGDATFPDGPDILTVVAKLKEDPSTVTVTNPLTVQGRISWSESQA